MFCIPFMTPGRRSAAAGGVGQGEAFRSAAAASVPGGRVHRMAPAGQIVLSVWHGMHFKRSVDGSS